MNPKTLTLILSILLASCSELDCVSKIRSNPEHVKQLLATKQCPGCDLGGANLRGANLAGANLQGAELIADLRGANLKGANMKDAILTGANLKGATMPDGKIHP